MTYRMGTRRERRLYRQDRGRAGINARCALLDWGCRRRPDLVGMFFSRRGHTRCDTAWDARLCYDIESILRQAERKRAIVTCLTLSFDRCVLWKTVPIHMLNTEGGSHLSILR